MSIVHSDLKSENILMTLDFQNKKVESAKIIDFGTSFKFENLEISKTDFY